MIHKNIKISSLDHYGRGIARIDDKVIFVINALPNEVVDIEIIEEKKSFSVAVVKKYIELSSDRRKVDCIYYNECGGCNIMHMNYDSQLKFKKDKVINIIKKYSNIVINPSVIKSNNEFNYRNKVVFHSKGSKFGFYKENSNDIIDIKKCLIINRVFDKEIKKHNLDELILRSNEKDEVISNESESNIIKTINNYKFKVNINSFFQVNDYICSKLFDIVNENSNDNVLDLYSGVGTLGIVCSNKVKSVVSVESNKYAFKNIEENIKLNNVKNIICINNSVENFIKSYKDNCNVVLLDPPRSGVNKNILEFINSNIKKVIYISCNPMTLARDLKMLNNYKIIKSYILDMFPNTYHVETVLILEKE